MKRRIIILIVILASLILLSTGAAAAQNSYALWFAKFWNNEDLEGNPVASASVGEIDYNWGTGPATSGMPNDHWSAQWTAIVEFSPGTYRFTTISDDGVGVFLGDKHVIFDWNSHPLTTNVATVSLVGGKYPMAVSYFDDTSHAELRFYWERIGPPKAGAADVTVVPPPPPPPPPPLSPQASWTANYWNNTGLAGAAVVTRSEPAIDYNWGTGSPVPGVIGVDNFSARWSRSVYFATGKYRFTSQSDDGIRVFINGNAIINNWSNHPVTTDAADVDLVAGTYALVVEHFEGKGEAVAKLSWQLVGAPTTPPAGGVTATINSGALNMRSGPGLQFQILTALPRGTIVPVIGRTATNRWIQVTYQGMTGWMSAPYTIITGNLNSLPVTG